MNFYSFHIGDYTTHTAHLEPMEDLAFRRLLDLYYLREAALPADVAECARLIRMKQFQAEVESVLKEFFVLTNEGWMNVRCSEEVGKMKDKQAKARASALQSVNARSTNAERTLSERSTNAERPLNEGSATNTNTNTNTNIVSLAPETDGKPSKTKGSRLPDDFVPDLQFAADNGIRDVGEEVSRFRDYWTAQPGSKGVKLDWAATWRNWCRESKSRRTNGYRNSFDEKRSVIAELTGKNVIDVFEGGGYVPAIEGH